MTKLSAWAAPALWIVTVLAAVVVLFWPGARGLAESGVGSVLVLVCLLAASALITSPDRRRAREARAIQQRRLTPRS